MPSFADYATTAAANTAATPNGAPEGMAPSTVNDVLRELMARARSHHDGTLAQVDSWCGPAGGTADAIALTPAAPIAAYAAGQTFRFTASGANTTATPTIAVSGLATKPLQRLAGALAAGDIPAGATVEITYDGAYFQLTSVNGNEVRKSSVGAFTRQQYFGEATLADGATINWDLDVAQTARVTLGGNRTLANPSNMRAGGCYILRVVQDGIGGRVLTLGSNYKKAGGAPFALSATAGATDIISFYSDGTYMYVVPSLGFA